MFNKEFEEASPERKKEIGVFLQEKFSKVIKEAANAADQLIEYRCSQERKEIAEFVKENLPVE